MVECHRVTRTVIVQQCFLCDANAQHIHNPLNMCCCMHDDGWSSLQTAQLHFTRHIYNPINMRCCLPRVLELQIIAQHIALPYLSAIGLGCTDDLQGNLNDNRDIIQNISKHPNLHHDNDNGWKSTMIMNNDGGPVETLKEKMMHSTRSKKWWRRRWKKKLRRPRGRSFSETFLVSE